MDRSRGGWSSTRRPSETRAHPVVDRRLGGGKSRRCAVLRIVAGARIRPRLLERSPTSLPPSSKVPSRRFPKADGLLAGWRDWEAGGILDCGCCTRPLLFPPAPVVRRMKLRSALLVLCMLVVPGVAMFSHRIPVGMRTAVREAVGRGVAWWQGPSEAAGPSVAAAVPASGGMTSPPAAQPPPVVAKAVIVAVGPSPGQSAQPRRDLERRLEELGGMSFECRPMQGLDGMHVASCRVALDASGQLMRVFQASGADADNATRALVSDVAAWKQRMALRGPAGPASVERRF